MNPIRRLIILVIAALATAACGGGGDAGTTQTVTTVTPSATAAVPDTEALLDYHEDTNETAYPGRKTTQSSGTLRYRTYPETGNTIGIDGDLLVTAGPIAGGSAVPVPTGKKLADFACEKVPAACGKRSVEKVVVGGVEREFIVYVPWLAKGKSAVPVVFMLHGTNQSGDQFFRISGWREKADETGELIPVFPTALVHCYYEDEDANGTVERNLKTKWAAGQLGDPVDRPLCSAAEIAALPATVRAQVDHPLADDMGYLRAARAYVLANFATDPKRVYVTGFSNGAEMSGRVAAEASTLIAAAHSGSSAVSVSTVATRAISVIHTMGELEPQQSVALGYPSGVIPLTEDLAASPAWRGRIVGSFLRVLQISPTYTYSQLPIGPSLIGSQFAFTTSTVGASNTFRTIVIQGQVHEYPNGRNHPLRIADPLWAFFKTQALP